MKKSIFWRAVLTVVVLAAWVSLLIPFSDKPYIETFNKRIDITDKVLEKRIEADVRKAILAELQEAYATKVAKDAGKKTFDELGDYQKNQFYAKEFLTIEDKVKKAMDAVRVDGKMAEKKTVAETKMRDKLNDLLAKAQEMKVAADEASAKAEKAHATDPKVALIPSKSMESIILDLSRGDSKVKGFEEFTNLGDYVSMTSKDAPSNTDVVFYIRNCTRSRIKLGLDLAGGTEFVIAFDEAAVDEFNKLNGLSYSPEKCRDMVIETLRNRVDPHGVKEVEIRPNTATSISIRTPITDDAEIQRMRELLDKVGNLQFYLVHKDNASLKSQGRDPGAGYKKLPLKNRNDKNAFVWVQEKPEEVSGKDVDNAGPAQNPMGQWYVAMSFKHSGAAKMRQTTNSNNHGRQMAIVLDGVVFSAPTIQSTIGANGQITGDFTQQEAQKLGIILKSGSLPVKTRVDSMMTTNPTLGKEFVASGTNACLYGMALVVFFMLIYYRVGGLIAITALGANILLIIGSMPLVHAALTLPGIAGIVLTIGMAVDANVLIFERIREETIKGKSIASAVKNGYNRAFWTILDANLTTLFTAFFLYKFGSGTIKGFAVTLTLGILASMFTALFVTRWIFDLLIQTNILTKASLIHCRISSKYTEKNMFPDHPFVSLRKMAGMISAVLFIAAIGIFAAKGGGLSTDFMGGTQILMQYEQEASVDDVGTLLGTSGYKGARVTYKKSLASNMIEVVIGGEEAGKAGKTDEIIRSMNTAFPDAKFSNPKISSVGSLISGEFGKSAILSIVFALIVIILYISFRFEFGYGVGAVAALVHDVVICTGIYLACGRQISLTVIAALLTIIGYSLNDTIVVFDRIRENIEFYGKKKMNFLELVNMSLNQTLSRTLLTSVTTLLVVVTLFFFGGGAIDDFALIMIFGVIVGTYSSIFIATPVMIFVQMKLAAREEATPAAKKPATDSV